MLDGNYWEERYQTGNTAWDLGGPSPALCAYFQKIENKNLKILIPGAGKSHDLNWLHQHGFNDSAVIDISATALKEAKSKYPQIPKDCFIKGDFFAHQGTYDLIVEQTFFCALDPRLRQQYATKMYDLLKANGRLMGLLFDFPLSAEGPPFGGSMSEYRNYFSPLFEIKHLERAYNSIKPRAGKELFLELQKKYMDTASQPI